MRREKILRSTSALHALRRPLVLAHSPFFSFLSASHFLLFKNFLSLLSRLLFFMAEKGQPLPKFGEWDVNDPASAEGFTVIFNKARDEKKTGGNSESPGNTDNAPVRHSAEPAKPPSKKWLCCFQG